MDAEETEARAHAYLEHVLDRWRAPLQDELSERLVTPHASNPGEDFTLESMLVPAAVHPLHHALRLEVPLGPSDRARRRRQRRPWSGSMPTR